MVPGKLRATANSLCVAGSSIGAIIAPPLVAWLAIQYSWQTAFIVLGAVGLVIAVLWKLVYQDPPAHIMQEAVQDETAPSDQPVPVAAFS